MLLNFLLIASLVIALVGSNISWSEIQGMSNGPRKALLAVYALSWVIMICFGLLGIDYLYSYKEALR